MNRLLVSAAAVFFAAHSATAQNLLQDGGFDGSPQSGFGNRGAVALADWYFANAGPFVFTNTHNLVAVDGPGGYNYQSLGPESDASGAGAGTPQYYIDSGYPQQLAWQYFTPTCSGTATASLYVTNRDDHGIAGPTLQGSEVPSNGIAGNFLATEGALSVISVQSQLPPFSPNFGVLGIGGAVVQDMHTRHQAEGHRFVLGETPTRTSPWQLISYQVPVQAGQLYAYIAQLGHSVNIDNASVEVDCDTASTPPEINPTDISITKTCSPNTALIRNGQVGQLWQCSVDVSVPDAPFSGSLSIADTYTNTATTVGEVINAQSTNAAIDCSAGTTCIVDGADFDPSGTETLTYDVFITALSLEPTYPLSNCAAGQYTAPDGTETTVAGNCVPGQWIPRIEIDKTCDPIEPVTSGPNTLNCQLEVTTSDLATDSQVAAGDLFAGFPPATATIVGPMMNITSTEPWNCVDGQLNNPGSFGLCAISTLDLQTAGGTSTINVSFDFDVDQNPAQIANCPYSFTATNEQISGAMGLKTKPGNILETPSQNKSSGLPDNCVVLDVPEPTVVNELKQVIVTKSCREPVAGQIDGETGYIWDCDIEVNITPTPFTGTFTLIEDASQISNGSAVFVSSSVPCNGIGSSLLNCVMNGATLSSPTTVSVQLFAETDGSAEPTKWENCATGLAVAGSTTMGSQSCASTVIDPVKEPPLEKVTLDKSCGRQIPSEHEGAAGFSWTCDITVNAVPTPFAGTFTFADDATAISGSPNAQIINALQNSNAWTCTPNLPTQATECTINGADFDPSGTEVVSFELFAETGKKPIKWTNCVSGLYVGPDGNKEEVKGNCETTTWTPEDKTTFDIDKTCKATGERQQLSDLAWFQPYSCTITVSTNGVPFSHLLWITEELSYGTFNGNATMQQITSADPWSCSSAPYGAPGQANTNLPFCGIQGAQFPHSVGSSELTVDFILQGGATAQNGAENCVGLMAGETPATSPATAQEQSCFTILDPTDPVVTEPELSVTKTCEPLVFAANANTAPANCTITITALGLLPGQATSLNDTVTFTSNNTPNNPVVQGTTTNMTGATGLNCVDGTSTNSNGLSVVLCSGPGLDVVTADGTHVLNWTGDIRRPQAGEGNIRNCVNIEYNTGSGNQSTPGACHIFETSIEPPSKPKLDLTKTCEPAVRTGNQWSAQCEVTVTGSGLQPGQQFRITDELSGSNQVTVNQGSFTPGPLVGNNCGGLMLGGVQVVGCDLSTDDLIGNGGSITLPYTASLTASGLSSTARNCAYVDIPSLGLHAPGNAGDKACVTIPLTLTVIDGGTLGTGVLDNPAVVDDEDNTGGGLPSVGEEITAELNPNVFVPVPMDPTISIDKVCEPAIGQDGNNWSVSCQITLTAANLPAGEYVRVPDFLQLPTGASLSSQTLTGNGALCSTPNLCFVSTDIIPGAQTPQGGTYTLDYEAVFFAPVTDPNFAPDVQNCTKAHMFYNGNTQSVYAPEGSATNNGMCVPVPFDLTTASTPSTGTPSGDVQSCSLDTLFVVDRSGSMNQYQRMFRTKSALIAALQVFEGGGSKSGVLAFNHAVTTVGSSSALLPSPLLETEISALTAGGATGWKAAFETTNLVVAGLANKPLVLFISDGVPNAASPMPQPQTPEALTDVAIPYLNALRSQGSRVVGITLGQGNTTPMMTRLLGPNLQTANANSVVNPLTADVIEIPNSDHILRAFEQIAEAYCPGVAALTPKERADIQAAMQAVPKSAGVYQGDDEFPVVAPQAPTLELNKQTIGSCRVQRSSQNYECNYRIAVRNAGAAPYQGPIALIDQVGRPGARAIKVISGTGWSCGPLSGNAASCSKPQVSLAPGQVDSFDLLVAVNGLRNGGSVENCGTLGAGSDRTHRVALVQTLMNQRGLNAGPVDGKPGRRTYAALARLQETLGLPISREFDDALLRALGIPIASGAPSCARSNLPAMPAPPLQCNGRTTVTNGEACACRYPNMIKTSPTQCGCARGYDLVNGQGCVERITDVPTPRPTPEPEPKPQPQPEVKPDDLPTLTIEPGLTCDPRSTRLRGDQCVCIDQKLARKTSETTCGCTNGLPMVNGRCIPIEIKPEGNAAEGDKCRIKVNGICLK